VTQAIPDSHLADHKRLQPLNRFAATAVANILERWLQPRSVLDLGCGTGVWLHGFAAGGLRQVLGVEFEQYDPADLQIDPSLILQADLGQRLDLHRSFDLVICLEVAEHLESQVAAMVVENCVRHSDVVLFSAALPGQRGLRHVNEQRPEYWAALFRQHDYLALDLIRPLIWDDAQIPAWYRQNILLFVRAGSAGLKRLEAEGAGAPIPLGRAHPEILRWFSDEAAVATRRTAELQEQLRLAEVEAGRERRDLAARLSRAHAELKAVAQDRHALTAAHSRAEALIATLREEQRIILESTIWRLTAPLRRVGQVIPAPIRRLGRTAVNAAPGLRRSLRLRPTVARPAEAAELPPPRSALRLVYVSGEAHTPGHQYRVARYVEAAKAAGAKAWWLRVEDLAPRIDEVAAEDVVVMWRTPHTPEIERLIRTARARRARIVFDIDDLMFRPELATIDFIDGIRSQGFLPEDVAAHYDDIRRVLAVADVCTCTTTELAQQIRRFQKAAYVLPNGFDEAFHRASRLAVRRRRSAVGDGLVRIGYASGSRTHQRDFAEAAGAIAQVLAERPQCRLVLFHASDSFEPVLNIDEFPVFDALSGQIEWREMVPLPVLPEELARFDINAVPLELGNPFCEAKSELKYFEAALAEVCTVASPTGPMQRAIRDGETGLLAGTEEEWYRALTRLVDEPALRQRMAHAAYLDVLWPYSAGRRAELVRALLAQTTGGAEAARAFELELRRGRAGGQAVKLPLSDAVFVADRLGQADATVVIPLYNYEEYVTEALESVLAQTIAALDLVVVDDASTDGSLDVAAEWVRGRAERFNRVAVLRNRVNAGLALTRNAGFDAAETPYVLPLDADNRLLPRCVEACLGVVRQSGAAFAYPAIRCFGAAEKVIDAIPFEPMRLAGGNYIDAMALVSKLAWAAVGGFEHIEHGWEDYDFWCRCAEHGFWGAPAPEVLAEYRVHEASMLHRSTDLATNKPAVIRALEQRHSWLAIPAPD